MPAYEFCYLTLDGKLDFKFLAQCTSEQHAKILAHAMKSPQHRKVEVWQDRDLIYTRPAAPN